jgi:transcriptional regulator with XRE-family HTH domain
MWCSFHHILHFAREFLWETKEKTPTDKTMTFGPFIKEARISARLTLREFSRQMGVDPSNWSKIERDVTPPPLDDAFFTCLCEVLSLGPDALALAKDTAALSRGQIPADLQQAEILAKMPAFFRAIRGQEYDENDLKEMIEGVRKLHQP